MSADVRVTWSCFIKSHGLDAYKAFEKANPRLVDRIYGETALTLRFRDVSERVERYVAEHRAADPSEIRRWAKS